MRADLLARRKARAVVVVRTLQRLFPHAGMALVYGSPWELLVAVMLSAQCTDKKVNEVTTKLFKKYRTLEDYVHADPRVFERDIFQTGFYRQKAKHVLASAKIIQTQFGGKIPATMEEMLTLPGVARKTANVVLGVVYGIVEGIAVDTHVRRLTRRWGLTTQMDPVKIERDLLEILPQSAWKDFTFRTIEYGRQYCPAKRHAHERCPIPDAR